MQHQAKTAVQIRARVVEGKALCTIANEAQGEKVKALCVVQAFDHEGVMTLE
ncbi:MAG: hypothetical protein RBT67_02370 [Thauera sp.]|nr:hypothetical protein [Thauera sp.]